MSAVNLIAVFAENQLGQMGRITKVLADAGTPAWTVDNEFQACPARLRIETLLSCEPYDAPEGVTLTDFTNPAAFTDRACEEGVGDRFVFFRFA